MTLEIGVSIFVAFVTLVMIGATWHGRAKREPFVRELELHYSSLNGTPKTKAFPLPKRERHPTPKQSAKATRKR